MLGAMFTWFLKSVQNWLWYECLNFCCKKENEMHIRIFGAEKERK